MASSFAQKGVGLPSINTPVAERTPEKIRELTSINTGYLRTVIPANFLVTAKQAIVKKLMLMMFGPKNGPAAEYLEPSPIERERLINEAVCSSFAFTLSNPASVREEQLEYNRLAIARQLERGAVMFNISCQNVHVSLPANPSILFEGGGVFSQSTTLVTPAQSITLLVQHVGNQVQNINSENNRESGGLSFFEILIENLIAFLPTIIQPFLGPVYDSISNTPAAINAGVTPENTVYSTCDILNDPENTEKKKFSNELTNAIYKMLIGIMLVFALKNFKKLVSKFFATAMSERQKRKSEKIKNRFPFAAAAEKAKNLGEKGAKAAKYKAALSTIQNLLPTEDNG
jgi:hypothetical protein